MFSITWLTTMSWVVGEAYFYDQALSVTITIGAPSEKLDEYTSINYINDF
jgi:hypothetical protein